MCSQSLIETGYFTEVAQSVEHWSPKPGVGSSSLSFRAKAIQIVSLFCFSTLPDSINDTLSLYYTGMPGMPAQSKRRTEPIK